MKTRTVMLLGLALVSAVYGIASPNNKESSGSSTPVVQSSPTPEAVRAEGEQRFRANCGRCHAAPHKFPPRMMATIVRHMRVRATITDEDMKFILQYMTQ